MLKIFDLLVWFDGSFSFVQWRYRWHFYATYKIIKLYLIILVPITYLIIINIVINIFEQADLFNLINVYMSYIVVDKSLIMINIKY